MKWSSLPTAELVYQLGNLAIEGHAKILTAEESKWSSQTGPYVLVTGFRAIRIPPFAIRPKSAK